MKLQRILAFSLLATVVVVLTACESAKKVISHSKDAPDEFVVYQRPPLSSVVGADRLQIHQVHL